MKEFADQMIRLLEFMTQQRTLRHAGTIMQVVHTNIHLSGDIQFDTNGFLMGDPRSAYHHLYPYVEDKDRLPDSGCRIVIGMWMTLFIHENKLHPEVITLARQVQSSLEEGNRKFGLSRVRLNRYEGSLNLDFIKLPSPKIRAYIFHLRPNNTILDRGRHVSSSVLKSFVEGTLSSYALETRGPPRSDHFIMLLHEGSDYICVQAYHLNYTVAQWLNFDQPLERVDLSKFGDINPEWQHPLRWSPYRKLMDVSDITSFCQDIVSLTKRGDHIEAYGRLTSIEHTKQTIGRKYHVTYWIS